MVFSIVTLAVWVVVGTRQKPVAIGGTLMMIQRIFVN